MVKNIFVEEILQNYWEQFIVSKTPVVGLIIGKITSQRDYAVKLIKCVDNEESTKKFQINDAWVAGSAVEVSHMLPGGLFVIGVFAVTDFDDNMQSLLRQTLYHCHQTLARSGKTSTTSEDEDSLLSALHIDINSGKPLSCKQYDMRVPTSSAKPIEWKYQACSTCWSLIKTNLEVDETIFINKKTLNQQKLKGLVTKYCHKVTNAITCINGNRFQSSDIFDPSTTSNSSKGRKSKVSTHKWGKTSFCQVYLQSEDAVNSDDCKEVEPLNYKFALHIKGTIFACAYLPTKATVEDAVKELKCDAISSLHRRCVMAVEDVQEQHQKTTDNLVIVLPKRLGFTTSKDDEDFLYFDYAFESESKEDTVLRIKDLFDTVVEPESLICDLEEFPSLSLRDEEPTSLHSRASLSEETTEAVQPGYNATIGAVIAAALAVLTAGISYLTLSEG